MAGARDGRGGPRPLDLTTGDSVLDRLLRVGSTVVDKLIDFKNFDLQRDLTLLQARRDVITSPPSPPAPSATLTGGGVSPGGVALAPILVLGAFGLAMVFLARS